MDLNTYIKEKGGLIEKQLDKLIPEQEVPYKILFQAARYSVLGSGKRLRPILALATTEMLGSPIENALVPACALEMVHTYSCIHDDLPCMDNDDFRRGKPTLHKAFPEGHAVLAGDFLLTYAFEILANAPKLSAEQKTRLIAILANRSGGAGMIAGQVMDLEAEGKTISLEHLQHIHNAKTGAMIAASIEFGAVVANAPKEHLTTLTQFGQDIGLAFQIIDDILDVTSSEKKHGHKIASDLKNGKATYVALLGLEKSQTAAQALFEKAICKLRALPYSTDLLEELAQLIVHRKT